MSSCSLETGLLEMACYEELVRFSRPKRQRNRQ